MRPCMCVYLLLNGSSIVCFRHLAKFARSGAPFYTLISLFLASLLYCFLYVFQFS